jgi:hypothetical protein
MPLPQALDAAVAAGIDNLEKALRCTVHEAKSHRAVLVEGWGDDAARIEAVAAYLVGLLASAVSRALVVRSAITGTAADKLELLSSVQAITGTKAQPLSTSKKQDERNPWMAESIWHLCLYVASKRAELHPVGQIVAIDFPHVGAKDHGFDVVALYHSAGNFGLSFVESKAYANNPNGAISDAVGFYRAVDSGDHAVRARQTVATLRSALPVAEQGAISSSLWKDLRAYLPNPHYDAASAVDWTNTRPSFTGLKVARDQIIVMPHSIAKFDEFFDALGDAMLALAQRLKSV